MSKLPLCEDDGTPLEAGEDVTGRYLACPDCGFTWEVPAMLPDEAWQAVWAADQVAEQSPRDAALQRITEFTTQADAVRAEGGDAPEVIQTVWADSGSQPAELRLKDLKILLEEVRKYA